MKASYGTMPLRPRSLTHTHAAFPIPDRALPAIVDAMDSDGHRCAAFAILGVGLQDGF